MAFKELSPLGEKTLLIEPVTTKGGLERIQRLRYQICAVEHGQTHLEGTCHQSKTIADDLDHDLMVFGVFRDGALVGTLRWGLLSWTHRPHHHSARLEALGFTNLDELGVTDRLALAPGARGLATLRHIYGAVATRALNAGSVNEFCWASPRLAVLYARLGYRRTGAQVVNGAGQPLEILQLTLRPNLKYRPNPETFDGGLRIPLPTQAA